MSSRSQKLVELSAKTLSQDRGCSKSVSSKDALQGFHMKDMMKDYYARNFKSHSYVESTPKTIGNSDQSSLLKERANNSSTITDLPDQLIMTSNLLAVDADTLIFWAKSAFREWPKSVQFTPEEDKAIVKLPGSVDTSKKHSEILSDGSFDIHGQQVQFSALEPTRSIQVTHSQGKIHKDLLTGFFSNPLYIAGIKSSTNLEIRKAETPEGNVYIITFPSAEDVGLVLKTSFYEYAGFQFNVAEYHPDIGICNRDSFTVCDYKSSTDNPDDADVPTKLIVRDIDKEELNDLREIMEQKKTSQGVQFKFNVTSLGDHGRAGVEIIYDKPEVAEKAFIYFNARPIQIQSQPIILELESPKLLDYHDAHAVRISGLEDDLDPEKLKYYLSAIADTQVTQMQFDITQTKAVATFSHQIDFGSVFRLHKLIPLEKCAELRIHQEPKPCMLVTVTNQKKYQIEDKLEDYFKKLMDRKVTVSAKLIEGCTDKYKITIEQEALGKTSLEKLKALLTRCNSLEFFSEHLGLHTTLGVHKKCKNLREIVTDELQQQFLLNGKLPGYNTLSEYLHKYGITIAEDGMMTMTGNSGQSLKHWTSLRQIIQRFLESECLLFISDAPLTEQVFTQINKQLPQFIPNDKMMFGDAGSGKKEKRIYLMGLKHDVDRAKATIEQKIEDIEQRIQDEKEMRTVSIPNVRAHQLQYLLIDGYFERMERSKNLEIEPSIEKEMVNIKGKQTDIDDVQREMLQDLLPDVEKSKVSSTKGAGFMTILRQNEEQLQKKLLSQGVKVTWTIEHKTISIYAETRAISQKALDALNDEIWEHTYPGGPGLDPQQQKLLTSSVWEKKKAELMKYCSPILMNESSDRTSIVLVAVSKNRGVIMEKLKEFFDENTIRHKLFKGQPSRRQYLWTHMQEQLQKLQQQYNVQFNPDSAGSIYMQGTTANIANAESALMKLHDSIKAGSHVIDGLGRVQLIKEDGGILNTIATANNCMITVHEDADGEEIEEEAFRAQPESHVLKYTYGTRYEVRLPTGQLFEVRKGDITTYKCDAIVNAANDTLSHTGGLAGAIVNKGGTSIQAECNRYIKKKGRLMSGEAVSSGPGTLPCKRIIHAVGPVYNNGRSQEDIILSRCIDSCFEEGRRYKIKSMALPPISTGIFRYPLEEAIETIVDAIHQRVLKKQCLPDHIVFIDNKDDSLELYERELRNLFEKQPEADAEPDQAMTRPGNKQSETGDIEEEDGRIILPAMGNKDSAEVVLHIYGQNDPDIETCKQQLIHKLDEATLALQWYDKRTYHVDRELIIQLKEHQKRKLRSQAVDRAVSLCFDQKVANIKINGRIKDVLEMQDLIQAEFKKMVKSMHHEKEEELYARTRQWMYRDDDQKWQKFDKRTNKIIEEHHSADAKSKFTYETDESTTASVNLGKMRVTMDGLSSEIKREDMFKSDIVLPKEWAQPTNTYLEVIVAPGTPEFDQVKDNFMKTIKSQASQVLEVKRIQNATSYRSYMVLRKGVAERLAKTESEVETWPVWHGTDEKTAPKIARGKFDRGLSGKNATLYGAGSYFALNSSYSAQDKYSRPNANGEKIMFQARIVTGDYCQGDKTLRAAPYKHDSDTDQYDSVVDNLSNPSMFIIFHDAGPLPEYIIKFKK